MRKCINDSRLHGALAPWRTALLTGAACALVSGSSFAQGDFSLWEFEFDAEAVAVLSVGVDEGDAIDRENVLYGVSLEGKAERVFENGMLAGVKIGGSLQRDHPSRPGYAGQLSVQGGQAGLPSLTSFATGLRVIPMAGETNVGPRAQLETAYAFLKGGYGEARIGRDRGVASRFSEKPPTVFSYTAVDSTRLDGSGRSFVRADHDITGPSEKITLTTPRIIGVRGGISYTPSTSVRGLDRAILSGDTRIESVWEGAVNVSRRLPESGIRIEAGVAVSTGDIEDNQLGVSATGDMTNWSVSSKVDFASIEIGARYFASTQDLTLASGLEAPANDYTAWSIGAKKAFDFADISAEFGRADDDITGIEAMTWTIGASRDIRENVQLALGYRYDGTDNAVLNGDASGIVVEITLSR